MQNYPAELGIENEPKESEQGIPLVETLDIEKHILAGKGIQDSCSDDRNVIFRSSSVNSFWISVSLFLSAY